jgi:hypothetical protein
MRTCELPGCEAEFEPKRSTQRCCCAAHRDKVYRSSPKYKEYQRLYQQQYHQSPGYKEYMRHYQQSPEGKEAKRRYRQSPKGKEVQRKCDQSPKRKKAKRETYMRTT